MPKFVPAILVLGLIVSAASAKTVSCRMDAAGDVILSLDGAEMCWGFKPSFIKPKWQGTYNDLQKAESVQQDAGQARVSLGNFGTYTLTAKSAAPNGVQIDYHFDFAKPIDLEVGYLPIFLPGRLAQTGGTFRTELAKFQTLPAKAQKGFLFSGFTKTFTWTDGAGKAVTFNFPSGTFVQFQDSRQWNMPRFELMVQAPVPRSGGKADFAFTAVPAEVVQTVKPFVDKFGQATTKTWPGKVTDEAQLRADIAKENEFLNRHTPPDRDEFGGWKGSAEKLGLKATGFFRTEKVNNRWWLVDPKGNAFFSLASFFIACDIGTVVNNRGHLFEWLPEPYTEPWKGAWWKDSEGDCFTFYVANLIRKFGPDHGNKWAELSRRRWLAWGLNSTSAFSARLDGVPWTTYLPLPADVLTVVPGLGPADMFDPAFPQKLDAFCKERIAPLKDDPLLLGHFFGNEQPIEQLRAIVPTLPESCPIKRRLVQFLRDRYSTVDTFNHAWNQTTKDFDTLKPLAFKPDTPQAQADMDAFLELCIDTYGRLLRQAVKKYDPNHLLIGFRFLPGTAAVETVTRAFGKHLDVISVNYYVSRFGPAFIESVSKSAGDKPVLLSEWSFGTNDRGHVGGTRDTADQAERGACYRDYVENAAAHPAVVGTHWFQYTDQAITGRPWGGANAEAFQVGLIDVTDRPYQELIDALIQTNYRVYAVAAGQIKPFQIDDAAGAKAGPADGVVPIPRRTAEITIDSGLHEWLSLKPSLTLTSRNAVFGARDRVAGLRADVWLQWDPEYLYLAARAADPSPLSNDSRDAMIWAGDALELFFSNTARPDKGSLKPGDWQLLLNPGCPEKNLDPCSWLMQKAKPLDGAVLKSFRKANPAEWSLEAKIPWNNFNGFKPAPGLTIDFDLALDANDEPGKARSGQLIYHGSDQNHYTRAGWTQARLLP